MKGVVGNGNRIYPATDVDDQGVVTVGGKVAPQTDDEMSGKHGKVNNSKAIAQKLPSGETMDMASNNTGFNTQSTAANQPQLPPVNGASGGNMVQN